MNNSKIVKFKKINEEEDNFDQLNIDDKNETDEEIDDEYEEDYENDSYIGKIDEILFDDFKKRLNDNDNDMLNDIETFEEDVEVTLEQAVKDYNDGIKEAFDYIYLEYKPKLERLGNKMNNDDLAQELSIVLLNAIEKFDATAGAKFNTFFWKCAQNHIGTQKIRKNAKKRKCENGIISIHQTFKNKDSEIELESFIEDEKNSEDYNQSNLKIDLESIYPLLKNNERKAIEMIIDGWTLQEIGEKLGGITAPAVHVMLRRLGNKKTVGLKLKEIIKERNI